MTAPHTTPAPGNLEQKNEIDRQNIQIGNECCDFKNDTGGARSGH